MSQRQKAARLEADDAPILEDDPLAGEGLLVDAMFGGVVRSRPNAVKAAAKRVEKPQHYKIVSISLYVEDIEHLENLVREMKRRGHYKANKSQLIRAALQQVDLDRISRDG